MTSHLRFGFAGLWEKLETENKARSPQASEATGSHLGLDVGLRAAEASKHRGTGSDLLLRGGHSGKLRRVTAVSRAQNRQT